MWPWKPISRMAQSRRRRYCARHCARARYIPRLRPCCVAPPIEQRSAAAARRGGRLSPRPDRRRLHQDRRRRRQPDRRAQVLRRRAVLRARLQSHQRCLWSSDVHSRVFGCTDQGRIGADTTRGKREKIGRMVEMFAKESPIRSTRHAPATSLPSCPWQIPRPATPCATGKSRDPGAHALSRPRHQRVSAIESSKPNRKSSAPRLARWCAPIRPYTWKPIVRRVKRSCAVWASCIWR